MRFYEICFLFIDDLLRDVANYHLDCLACCNQVDPRNVLYYFREGNQKDLEKMILSYLQPICLLLVNKVP